MRTLLIAAAALSVVSVSAVAASASPVSGDDISAATAAPTMVDYYAFAGGRDASVVAPLQAGRSAAGTAPRAFGPGDLDHAFAPRGFAD